MYRSAFGAVGAAFVALSLTPVFSLAACLDPPGDVNNNGATTVTDVQCVLLANLWELGGGAVDPPGCLVARSGVGAALVADIDCSSAVSVGDVVLVIQWVLSAKLPAAVDADGSSCVDACELDTDQDLDPDYLDCAKTDPNRHHGAAESCNGVDDDCDGALDVGACDDGNACSDDLCDGAACSHVPLSGAACASADPCMGAGVCESGACVGPAIVCNDQNTCTQDQCVAGLGCVFTPLDTDCDDGAPCTANDRCHHSVCAGEPVPGCAAPSCGDGACAPSESCATCADDCSPVGMGHCGPACDPTSLGGCPLNFACVPSAGASLRAEVFAAGNGVCGAVCASDGECGGGACLKFGPAWPLAAPGVCGSPCTLGAGDCAGSCVLSATGQGVCVPFPACDPAVPTCPGGRCVSLGGPPVCMPGCAVSSGCGDLACVPLTAPAFHEGTCVGQPAACDLVGQDCGAGASCVAIGGGPIGGAARVCKPLAPGAPAQEGGSCGVGAECAAGLLCHAGACRAPCAPSPAAPSCQDIGAAFGLSAGELGVRLHSCGNGACEPGESCESCAADCGACPELCGDGACTAAESCVSCAADCGACATCGDAQCAPGETCADCPSDCGPCACGDGVCSATESCASCAADCAAFCVCGDGACSAAESCVSCPTDCGSCACGNAVCDPGENCGGCPDDCGACPCGNGACELGESCAACPGDCGACPCGNGTCEATETCAGCPDDCGFCVCGNGACEATETCGSCPADCTACVCGDGACSPGESCAECAQDCGACVCGDGACTLGETCADCPQDCHLFGQRQCPAFCDPTGSGGCPANFACAATSIGNVFVPALGFGNSVCAEGCHTHTDCTDGLCVRVGGLEPAGVCRQACNPAAPSTCPSGEQCRPHPEVAGAYVCLSPPCNPSGAACAPGKLSTCLRLSHSPSEGLCVDGCYQANPGVCGPSQSCLVKTDPEWHQGTCIGQPAPCDPVAQTGCAPQETCQLLGGLMFSGLSAACTAHVGSALDGEKCIQTLPNCAPGLACVNKTCRRYCNPSAPQCPAGTTCVDVSGLYYRPALEVGVCQ